MSTDYVPISCAFYDELEAAAVKHTINTIVYEESGKEYTLEAKIIDFQNINKEEFMVLESKQRIRLDKILLFNGIKPDIYESCRTF